MTKLAALLAALIVTPGCLVSDVTETWYVDANGAVTWVVHEKDVRSDANAGVDRQREEAEYWLSVQQDRHHIANAFREFGASRVRTVVLRGEVPFAIQTEGQFARIDALGQRLIGAVGGTGYSTLTKEGDLWDWKLVIRDPSAPETIGEPSDDVGTLVNSMEQLKVVLAVGRFESAEGFTISSDRRTATLSVKEAESKSQNEPAVTIRLVWK